MVLTVLRGGGGDLPGTVTMSDDEGAFVWGGGDGAGDDGDDFSNPALGGDDGDEDGSFVWAGGGGGDSSSDEDHSDSGSDRGGAAEPQSSLDLLGSLLAGADMTDAIRQPEPEPEPKAAPKKKNKRAGEVRPPSIHRSLASLHCPTHPSIHPSVRPSTHTAPPTLALDLR